MVLSQQGLSKLKLEMQVKKKKVTLQRMLTFFMSENDEFPIMNKHQWTKSIRHQFSFSKGLDWSYHRRNSDYNRTYRQRFVKKLLGSLDNDSLIIAVDESSFRRFLQPKIFRFQILNNLT
jgi:hypothetical protein